jgi:hypothetical protein
VLVKHLNAAHPCYDGKRLEKLRALVDGGPAWHKLKAEWFPKRPVEPAEVYAERQKLLTYTNHAGSIVSMLGAYLFAEAPQVSGLEGDYWSALWENCDSSGTPWRRFWRDRFKDAQTGRAAYVWVNLPDRAPDVVPANRAEEEKAGLLDGWLVQLLPEQVRNWEEDKRGRLTWILFRSVTEEQPSIDAPRAKVWRWTYLDATTIRRWEWKPSGDKTAPADEDTATELPRIAHGIGRLPVIRLQLPPELWAMNKLEDAAVANMRARNEHTWALHQAANELLVVTSAWADEKIEVGHGHYLRLLRDKDGKDEASYAAPSGVAFEYLQKDVADTREEVYRLLQQMALAADSDATRARMSGESKGQDWKANEILLSAYADLVKGSMREALALLLEARSETGADLGITGLDGWQSEDLMTFLEAVALAPDARSLSPSFRKAIAKRQARRLLQDEASAKELEAIEKEIEESDPEALDVMAGFRPPGGATPPGDDPPPKPKKPKKPAKE